MNIFVGNLAFSVSEDELRGLFEEHGAVSSLRLISDRDTGRSRGFGFVEMENAEADSAIKALNGMDFQGRNMKVNQAEDKKPRAPRRSY